MSFEIGPARRRSRRSLRSRGPQWAALGVVGALAFTLASCSHHHLERACLDTVSYKVVADQLCDGTPGHGLADADRYQWYEAGGDSFHLHGFHRLFGDKKIHIHVHVP